MSAILTINGGSSSIRFALYEAGVLRRTLVGKIDRIGQSGATLTANDRAGKSVTTQPISGSSHRGAVSSLLAWIESRAEFGSLVAIGHRVVHGMTRSTPELVTPELLEELRRITAYDPDHLPAEIGLIEAFHNRHPKLPQIACFDTAFHRTMPRVAKILPIPRRYEAKGVQRYGFHGLSYAYLMEELDRLKDPAAKKGAVILAHLGSGASMAAVRDGKSIDTTMCFTPTAGLVMSTRSGDLDPGISYYLSRTEDMTPPHFQRMVNHESGLLGVSETTSDMRDLLERAADDERAAEAVELFCYSAKKWIGSFAAALGGLNTLVFAGGVGENSPVIRERICKGLGFLGVELDGGRNAKNAPVISQDDGGVCVRVIPTDEELMIARSVCRLLNHDLNKEN